MSGTHRTTGTAVLADQNGRRRRALMIVGALGGTLTLACAAVLIGGTFNGSRLDAVNRPGGDAPSTSATAPPSSQEPPTSQEPTTRSPTARPLRTATPRTRHSTPATPTPVRTRPRTAGAVTPSGTTHPSRPATPPTTRPATRPAPTTAPTTTPVAPTTSPTANGTDHRPPGRTKEPQRGGQDKTHGPKR